MVYLNYKSLFLTLLIVILAGCTGFPENAPLDSRPLEQGYRYKTLDAATTEDPWSRETLVFLTLSGGGTRAAAFAYGAMDQLRQTQIDVGGRTRTLLDEVDIISSNSGGSYAAAYYGLFRDATFAALNKDGKDPENFETRFLRRPFESELFETLFNPVTLFKIASPRYSRTDKAAELVDELFYNKTFADLKERGKPLIVLNAHDTSFASRFEFTQEQFDLICSDLAPFPVGRAVMASSALHGAFRSLRLVNYKGSCWNDIGKFSDEKLSPIEKKIQNALTADTKNANLIRYLEARRLQEYRYGKCWPYQGKALQSCLQQDPKRLTVHLNDGGAVDNLGIDTVNDYFSNDLKETNAFKQIQLGKIKRVILIVVNASNVQQIDQIEKGTETGAWDIALQGLNATIDAKSVASLKMVDELMSIWKEQLNEGDREMEILPPILAQMEVLEGAPANPERVKSVECFGDSIGTTFALSDNQVDAAIQAGRKATAEAGGMSELLKKYNGFAPPVETIDYCNFLGCE